MRYCLARGRYKSPRWVSIKFLSNEIMCFVIDYVSTGVSRGHSLRPKDAYVALVPVVWSIKEPPFIHLNQSTPENVYRSEIYSWVSIASIQSGMRFISIVSFYIICRNSTKIKFYTFLFIWSNRFLRRLWSLFFCFLECNINTKVCLPLSRFCYLRKKVVCVFRLVSNQNLLVWVSPAYLIAA